MRPSPAFLTLALLLLSAYLALQGLDNSYFWMDEADTGIVAKSFLASGHLGDWDGNALNVFHPPLMYWVTAASFYVLGVSTWAARFPFVLAGLASLGLFALVVRKDFRAYPALGLYAVAILCLSVTFLLTIRPCRYYSFSILFSLASYYFYQRCLEREKILDFAALAISGIVLFLTHYLMAVSFLVTLVLVHLVFHRHELNLRKNLLLSGATLFFLAFTSVFFLSLQIHKQPGATLFNNIWDLERLLRLQYRAVWHLNCMNILPWTLSLALLFFTCFYSLRKDRYLFKKTLEWLALAVGSAILTALLAQDLMLFAQRYLILSIPFGAGLMGITLWHSQRICRPGAWLLFFALVFSNLLILPLPNVRFSWLFPLYVREIHQKYPTATERVVEYLSPHAQKNDVVCTIPDCDLVYPLAFYLGDTIKACPVKHKYIPADQTLLIHRGPAPDWIISYGFSPGLNADASLIFPSTGDKYVLVKSLKIFYCETQRPEILWHHFGPKQSLDWRAEGVHIFKKQSM